MTARSYLFVPGNRLERLDAASRAGADVVLIDLEDAVAPPLKHAARRAAAEWLETRSAYLRINGSDSEWFAEDLPLLGLPGVQGVMLAKAEATEAIVTIQRMASPALPVIPLIESARGL